MILIGLWVAAVVGVVIAGARHRIAATTALLLVVLATVLPVIGPVVAVVWSVRASRAPRLRPGL